MGDPLAGGLSPGPPAMAPTLLTISHGHPDATPGGGEIAAYDLHRGMREYEGWKTLFLHPGDAEGEGRLVRPFRGAADEFVLAEGAGGGLGSTYDLFTDWRSSAPAARAELRGFLRGSGASVVHVHHVYRVGVNVIGEVRRALPDARVVMTLHDYKAICPAGYMVRTRERRAGTGVGELCREASARRCAECLPEVPRGAIARREARMRGQLSRVDRFVAPSRFLAERYREWGVPGERIEVIDYGRVPPAPSARPAGDPWHFAYFGRFTPVKGLGVLVGAFLELAARRSLRGLTLSVFGPVAGEDPAVDAGVAELRRAGLDLRMHGPYAPGDVHRLITPAGWIVVPSTWWENSPLVIQEAFMHGKPVLCSDAGGMAEKVEHGRSGLRFRLGDPRSLADTILHAAGNAELHRRLRDGIPPVPSLGEACGRHASLYSRLLAGGGAPQRS